MAVQPTTGPSCQVVQNLTISPNTVAGTIGNQTFSLKGLRPGQQVLVTQVDSYVQAGFTILDSYCNTNDVLTLVFLNLTGSSYSPAASQTVQVVAL